MTNDELQEVMQDHMRYIRNKYGNRDMQDEFMAQLAHATNPRELWAEIEARNAND